MSTASEEPDHLWFTSPGALTLLIKYYESEFLTMITKYSHYDNKVFWSLVCDQPYLVF